MEVIKQENMWNKDIPKPDRFKFGASEGSTLTSEANKMVIRDAKVPPKVTSTDTPPVTIQLKPNPNAPAFVPFAQIADQAPVTIQSLISVAKELRRQMNELNAQGINVLIYSDTFGCEISDWKVKIDTEI